MRLNTRLTSRLGKCTHCLVTVSYTHLVKVLLKSFDDSCITRKIVVWVNVLTQASDDATIMECIYDTLNDHNIEIPFPQREITIKPVSYTHLMIKKNNVEVARFDSLINYLYGMNTMFLSEEAQVNRNEIGRAHV